MRIYVPIIFYSTRQTIHYNTRTPVVDHAAKYWTTINKRGNLDWKCGSYAWTVGWVILTMSTSIQGKHTWMMCWCIVNDIKCSLQVVLCNQTIIRHDKRLVYASIYVMLQTDRFHSQDFKYYNIFSLWQECNYPKEQVTEFYEYRS